VRDERKARCAEAVWRVIIAQGIGAVSVRVVAAEAGLAVGSLRHLFPSKTELLEFSAELMVQRATERINRIMPREDLVEYALQVISEVLPFTPETRREFEVNIALIAETPGQPSLAKIRDQAHLELVSLFTRLVMMLWAETEPSESAIFQAKRLHVLADGIGLQLLHQTAEEQVEWAGKMMRIELERISEYRDQPPTKVGS